MSEAVLRARNQYVTAHTGYKVTLLPRHPSEAELPSDYVNLVLESKPPRPAQHSHQEQELSTSKAESVMGRHDKREWAWVIAISVTAMIILVGLAIGYLRPGPITGAILPFGVAMWWLLYKLADHLDQPT
jgi:hypothetical protein